MTGFEPSRYSANDAALLVTTFTRAERVCSAGKTLAATRVAESNRHVVSGDRSAAEWLAKETGGSVGEAVDLLRLGQTLESQPEVEQAYRNGKLSPSRAKLVANAVKVNPGREGELVNGAEKDTLRQLKERCLRAKAEGRSSEEAARAQEAIRQARRCRTWTNGDGAFRLDALLTPDAGAKLSASLTVESDRMFRQARTAGRHEPSRAYAADALVALVTGQNDGGSETLERSPSHAGSAPRTDVGGDRVRADHGAPPEPDAPAEPDAPPVSPDKSGRRGRAPTAAVLLRVDLDALRRGSVGDGDTCEIPGVGPVPIETARSLMGDAITDLVITNGVDVTTVCHLGRSIPAPLKTALIERDRCCVVPGCDVSRGLEIDHWRISFARRRAGDSRESGQTLQPSSLPAHPPGLPAPGRAGPMALGSAEDAQNPESPENAADPASRSQAEAPRVAEGRRTRPAATAALINQSSRRPIRPHPPQLRLAPTALDHAYLDLVDRHRIFSPALRQWPPWRASSSSGMPSRSSPMERHQRTGS